MSQQKSFVKWTGYIWYWGRESPEAQMFHVIYRLNFFMGNMFIINHYNSEILILSKGWSEHLLLSSHLWLSMGVGRMVHRVDVLCVQLIVKSLGSVHRWIGTVRWGNWRVGCCCSEVSLRSGAEEWWGKILWIDRASSSPPGHLFCEESKMKRKWCVWTVWGLCWLVRGFEEASLEDGR